MYCMLITMLLSLTNLNVEKNRKKNKKWKTELASEFTECLNDCDISNMMAELDRLDSTGSAEQNNINTAVDEINRIFCTTELNISATSDGSRPSGPQKSRARKIPHQQWYNQECENRRKICEI